VYPAAVNKQEIESPKPPAAFLLRVVFFAWLAIVGSISYRQ
jgi:hypothetical protein